MAVYNPYAYPNYSPYQQPAVNNGGVVSVQSEQEARYYPVAPATTVVFVNDKEGMMYRKTVGNSMDAPNFEVYKRIEESKPKAAPDYVQKEEFDSLKAELEAIKKGLGKKGE